MNPTDAAGWWQIAFDGIIGGVLTCAIAGGAVWATLRLERRLTIESDLRHALTTLMTTALQAADGAKDAAEDVPAIRESFGEVLNRTFVAGGLAQRPAPELSEDLKQLAHRLSHALRADWGHSRRDILKTTYLVWILASVWITDPTTYVKEAQ